MKTYDQWKLSNADDEAEAEAKRFEPEDEDDGREAWLSGVIDQIKTKRDEIAPRAFEWIATVGDYDLDDPIGRGATEAEAIQDLLEQLEK